jgi:hypothetical protein
MRAVDLTKLVLITAVVLQLAGCGLLQDRRDAPWDPRGGGQLIDQIPNWDHAASRQCGDYTNGRVPRC